MFDKSVYKLILNDNLIKGIVNRNFLKKIIQEIHENL